jgi:hypothetical protein
VDSFRTSGTVFSFTRSLFSLRPFELFPLPIQCSLGRKYIEQLVALHFGSQTRFETYRYLGNLVKI